MTQFDYAVVHDFEGATRNFEQIAAAGMYVGSGVPAFRAQKGNYYFRTDTPTTANQRLYVCTGGATWVSVESLFLQSLSPETCQFGSTNFTWSASSADQSATVSHSLGRTPTTVICPNQVIIGSRSWQCFTGTYTSTTFALLARPDGVFTGTGTFSWVAIG